MKSFLILGGVLLAAISGLAQTAPAEKDFESRKARYTFKHFVEGEDATSGYDYLYYKSAGSIVKIRSIWSASYSKQLRIEDMYFNGTDLLLCGSLRHQAASSTL